jgi:alkanesulfonate monooxygenase SsuD/methylene tetrahydromethanopterin reductase-like flavin-dependent oxidoreductase (luciferase family)
LERWPSPASASSPTGRVTTARSILAAQLADEFGFESFWVPEAWGYDVVALITEMALHTRRIELATGIVNV